MYSGDGHPYPQQQPRAVFWRLSDSSNAEPQDPAACADPQRQAHSPEYNVISPPTVVAPTPVPAYLQTHPSRFASSYPYRHTHTPDGMNTYESSGIATAPHPSYYPIYPQSYNMTPAALHASTSVNARYADGGSMRRAPIRNHDQHSHPYLARGHSISPLRDSSSPALSRSTSMNSIGSSMTASGYPVPDGSYVDSQRCRAPPPSSSAWPPSAGDVDDYRHAPRLVVRGEQQSLSMLEPSMDSLLMLKKKKKSKMHQCEICMHEFPRPSGLRTHMNSHNNIRPYGCSFPGCKKTFGVRSNAKRHLRTHGSFQSETESGLDDQTYTDPDAYLLAGYYPSASTSSQSQPGPGHATSASTSYQQSARASSSLLDSSKRWVPTSLLRCSNASRLREATEFEYEEASDDYSSSGSEPVSVQSSQLTMPLPAVVRSVTTNELDDSYEERDSYMSMPEFPYHPSQFRFLPGPSAQPVAQAVR